MRLTELNSKDWIDDEDPLTAHEKALLDARLAAYAKDPDAGSTWEEVESRIRMALLKGIARGEKAIEEGQSLTHGQAQQRMSRWLK